MLSEFPDHCPGPGRLIGVNAEGDLGEKADGDFAHQVLVLPERQFRVDPSRP